MDHEDIFRNNDTKPTVVNVGVLQHQIKLACDALDTVTKLIDVLERRISNLEKRCGTTELTLTKTLEILSGKK